jgi:hypothetical protein
MKTLVQKESLEQKTLTGLKFKTFGFCVEGEGISLEVPGREKYMNLQKVEVFYDKPLKVNVGGLVIPGEKIELKDAEISIEGEKINKMQAHYEKVKVVPKKDPEIRIYSKGGNEIYLSQAMGIPKVYVQKGKLSI